MEVEVIKAKDQFDSSSRATRKERLRVAAYCRVSTNDEDQIKSYDSMVTYYTDLINKNPEWEYVDVYADKASTGTKAETRENFQRLIADCMAGKIDLVIAKSLSRFARNTLDTLKYVRQLREKKVAIYFEVEKINTMKDGEFLLTILSSVAQQEVENTSAYVKKGLKMKMKRGELVGFQRCLGYDYDFKTKQLTINEEGAEIVRFIFRRYNEGAGSCIIARELNEKGIPTVKGNKWTLSGVMGVIRNEKYTGDVLMGKTFTVDPISKRRLENFGEEDQFYIKDHHEPIVSREVFEKAQAIRSRRNVERRPNADPGTRKKYSRIFAFSSVMECGFCGSTLTRRRWHSSSKYKKVIWQCITSTNKGKRNCPDSKGIPEQVIEDAFLESYKLICSENSDVMDEFLKKVEKSLEDDTIKKSYNKANAAVVRYIEKRKSLLEKYLENGVEKDLYESTDKDYRLKQMKAEELALTYKDQLQDKDELREKIKAFKATLEEKREVKEFDRKLFESLIEKVIVGGYDDEGNKDPYKVTFIYRNGFDNSFGNAKNRFGGGKGSKGFGSTGHPASSGGTKLCSNDMPESETLLSNGTDDTC